MRHITNPCPSPFRPLDADPVFTGLSVPRTLTDFVWRISAWDQLYIAILSVMVSGLGTLPIEMQRRIVNEAVKGQNFQAIESLAGIYVMLVLVQGLVKLLTNTYRSWISANSVRLLRTSIGATAYKEDPDIAKHQGVKISMIVMEADAIGNFVGDAVGEPVSQVATLLIVFGYLVFLQPIMAALVLMIFIIQMIFVPLMQMAINRRVEKRISILRKAGTDVIVESGSEETPTSLYNGRFTKVFRLDMGIFKLKFTLNFLMNLTQHLGTVAVIAFGAWFVIHGKIQVGTVVAFLSGLNAVNDPWGDIVNWYQNLMVTRTKYHLMQTAVVNLAEEPRADQAPSLSNVLLSPVDS